MANGTVKWFNDKKGYGFIQSEDGQDIFVHHTGINGSGFKTLKDGDRVTFDITQGFFVDRNLSCSRLRNKIYPKTPPILVPATRLMINRQAAPSTIRIRPNAAASFTDPPI